MPNWRSSQWTPTFSIPSRLKGEGSSVRVRISKNYLKVTNSCPPKTPFLSRRKRKAWTVVAPAIAKETQFGSLVGPSLPSSTKCKLSSFLQSVSNPTPRLELQVRPNQRKTWLKRTTNKGIPLASTNCRIEARTTPLNTCPTKVVTVAASSSLWPVSETSFNWFDMNIWAISSHTKHLNCQPRLMSLIRIF